MWRTRHGKMLSTGHGTLPTPQLHERNAENVETESRHVQSWPAAWASGLQAFLSCSLRRPWQQPLPPLPTASRQLRLSGCRRWSAGLNRRRNWNFAGESGTQVAARRRLHCSDPVPNAVQGLRCRDGVRNGCVTEGSQPACRRQFPLPLAAGTSPLTSGTRAPRARPLLRSQHGA